MIPADVADIVPSSSEELTEELCFPKETVEIRVVLGEGEDIGTLLGWFSKVASGIVGISEEGILMDVFRTAERLVEGLMFKVNVEKSTEEFAKSIAGLSEVPSVSRDETGVWVAVIFWVKGDVLLTMGTNEELVGRDVTEDGTDVDNKIANKDDDLVREGSLGMKVPELCATGSVFNSVHELLGYSVISEVVINVVFGGNSSVLRGKTVELTDFLGFLEMDDTEKESVSIMYLFSVEALLAIDISETVGLTRRTEAVERIL